MMQKYPSRFLPKYVIISPFIELNRFFKKEKKLGKKVLHIKGTNSKGIAITLALAKEFPNEEFLICGKLDRRYLKQIKILKNVSYIGYKSDIREVYKMSKLLLIPTINRETFSISSVEAQSMGLNILVNKGGIPAPKKTYVNSTKISDWIQRFKEGGDRLKGIRLKSFDAQNQYKKFEKLIERLR